MSASYGAAMRLTAGVLHRLSIAFLVIATVSLAIFTLGGAFAQWPHLTVAGRIGNGPVMDFGLWLQGGATVLLAAICAILPGNARILKLESEHRKFALTMEDIARAYHASHSADRAGLFTAKSEFDSVRERLRHLREHPDLGRLEPEILEIAAQMSHLSRDLAETYSDEKVARARRFLKERQDEIALFNDRLIEAKTAATELRQWVEAVEIDEAVARSQIDRIRAELIDLMPELFGAEPEAAHPQLVARSPDQILHPPRPFNSATNPFDFDAEDAELEETWRGPSEIPRPLLDIARRAAE